MQGVKKQHLPEKLCVVCERPFVWRRKWAKDWDAVKYCSVRCRNQRRAVKSQERVQDDA